ncbi:hypothetical protein D3C75_1002430 [compost metagenome]
MIKADSMQVLVIRLDSALDKRNTSKRCNSVILTSDITLPPIMFSPSLDSLTLKFRDVTIVTELHVYSIFYPFKCQFNHISLYVDQHITR